MKYYITLPGMPEPQELVETTNVEQLKSQLSNLTAQPVYAQIRLPNGSLRDLHLRPAALGWWAIDTVQ